MDAARAAGSLSILTWTLAAVVVALLALVYAELAPMFPKSGGLVHMSLVSHGKLLGRIWSWILFLAYVSIAPVEAMAVVTYANSYLPGLVNPHTLLLTPTGVGAAILVLGVMTALNFMILRLVLLFNNIATWLKICTPLFTIAILLIYSHHGGNLIKPPEGHHKWTSMFTSVSTAGVFFSLFGFRQPIDLAGETKNPGRVLPIAVLSTIGIGAVIFILLQYAFVTAVPPVMLAKSGWHQLAFGGISGPFAGLSVIIGASFWATVLYADAIISPAMCGYMWVTTTPRVLYAMGEENLWPQWLCSVNQNGVPWLGVIATFLVGILFLLPFPSWQKLVDYASSATVLSYGIGPVVLLAMRSAKPNLKQRSFKLPGAKLLASLAFIASNYVMFWAGYGALTFLLGLISAAFVLYALYQGVIRRRSADLADWRSTWWLIPYFLGMWLVSYLGPQSMGGRGLINIYEGMGAIAILSLAILVLSLKVSLPSPHIAASYNQMVRSLSTDQEEESDALYT